MRTTDIKSIREMAILFAHLPIEPHQEFPFLVSHPFITVSKALLPDNEGNEMIDVLEGDGEERFRAYTLRKLNEVNDSISFLMMITKAYRFTFLDHIQRYLSDDDLGRCLRFIWTNSEYSNSGAVFTKRRFASLFRCSTKISLMDEGELSVFQELPERIIIYRGTNSKNSKDLKVFSWTLSRERAEWYAGRFNDEVQNVFRAELPKPGVLAYFHTDKEIVADPSKLENIQKIE